MSRQLPNLYQLPAVRRDDGKRPGLPVESTELLQRILDGYLAQLSDADLCEANILELCMSIRGADECNDPDDELWKALCARFGLTERFDEAPTWRETFLGMCKEIARLTPEQKEVLWEDVPVVKAEDNDYRFEDPDWRDTDEVGAAVIAFWFNCAFNGLRYTMAYLLSKLPLLIDTQEWLMDLDIEEGYLGDTALIIAIKNGDLETVQFLLEHDADVDRKDEDGRTALMHADDARKVEIVRLADFGVNPFGPDTRDGAIATILRDAQERRRNLHGEDGG